MGSQDVNLLLEVVMKRDNSSEYAIIKCTQSYLGKYSGYFLAKILASLLK
jgi:hypothetical protein